MRELFVNACILFTCTCIGFFPFRHQRLTQYRMRLLLGPIAGIAGLLLMLFTLRMPGSNVILDFRIIPITAAAAYGGLLSSVPAAIIISAGRLLLFGYTATALKAAVSALVIGLVAPLLARFIPQRYRLSVLNVYALAQSTYLLRDVPIHLIALYWLLALGMGILVQVVIVTMTVHYNQQAELRKYAEIDFLTGLNNIRQFHAMFAQKLAQCQDGTVSAFSLLMLDIDHFKRINDTYGHAAGDEVLKQLARLLIRNCREADFISRNGGEEFSVILADCGHEAALDMAERIRAAVAVHTFSIANHQDIHVTVSIGVSTNEVSNSSRELMKRADEALYRAKNTGRNRVCTT